MKKLTTIIQDRLQTIPEYEILNNNEHEDDDDGIEVLNKEEKDKKTIWNIIMLILVFCFYIIKKITNNFNLLLFILNSIVFAINLNSYNVIKKKSCVFF